MARIEKTVFISYRRKDISWALAVYQYLTSQKYDVFFDYTSIPSGDFEQIIVSNIKARAHFILILTPTALDRCNNPGDWLRREIETAIDEKRNIIPLFFDGFSFGSPSVAEKMTGKLGAINHYNGLDIPAGYFLEAMDRLRSRYLNVPLSAILHPIPDEVWKVVKEEQIAADEALLQKQEDIQELVKPAEEGSDKPEQAQIEKGLNFSSPRGRGVRGNVKLPNLRRYGIGVGILLILLCGFFGVNYIVQNISTKDTSTPTNRPSVSMSISPPIGTIPTEAITFLPTESSIPIIPAFSIGSVMISPKDGMVMVYVPAGKFIMGSDANNSLEECQRYYSECQLDRYYDEEPRHFVYLDSFWIDKTEITNAMYAKCVQADSCNLPSVTYSHSRDSYYGNSEYDHYPVIFVSWIDASAYCTWANRRLPTEAEWEKTASWDDDKQEKRIYPWGDSIDCTYANYWGEDGGCVHDSTAVGSYPSAASFYGALDMTGNVWEWVADWYSETYYQNSPSSNPLGPDSGLYAVLRGGSGYFVQFGAFSTLRIGLPRDYVGSGVGFRCAMSASK